MGVWDWLQVVRRGGVYSTVYCLCAGYLYVCTAPPDLSTLQCGTVRRPPVVSGMCWSLAPLSGVRRPGRCSGAVTGGLNAVPGRQAAWLQHAAADRRCKPAAVNRRTAGKYEINSPIQYEPGTGSYDREIISAGAQPVLLNAGPKPLASWSAWPDSLTW